jgi:copper transport protein
VGVILIGISAAIAWADALSSHAVTAQPAFFWVTLSAIHVLAMSLWVGAIIATIQMTSRGWSRIEVATFVAAVRRPVGIALGLLFLTGLAMALQHLTSFSDLASTGYGQALLVKLAVILVAISLGALSARSKTPRWQLLRAEALALGVVLGIAGYLVSFPPPR